MIHLAFAVSTALLWIIVVTQALRKFSKPPAPGDHSPRHVKWAKIAALDHWWKTDLYSATEQACLRFAEQFALDPGEITDAVARPVVEALGEPGTVAFVEALAIFDGFSRFSAILGIAPAGDAP